jgi:hypothetical protein
MRDAGQPKRRKCSSLAGLGRLQPTANDQSADQISNGKRPSWRPKDLLVAERRRNDLPRNLGAHNRSPTAFPANNSPQRMYLPSAASEAWPVCALIFQIGTSAMAALVTNPARREWPE